MNKRQYTAALRLFETAERGQSLKRFSIATIDNALKLEATAHNPVYRHAGTRITAELLRRINAS